MQAILVVDDEHIIADTLALILRQSGYRADTAYSGEEALSYLDQRSPDLVISDVMMPGMNGVELAIRVADGYHTPVLLVSGNATTSDLLKKSGKTFTLLCKPIHPVELLNHIARLIAPEDSSGVSTAIA